MPFSRQSLLWSSLTVSCRYMKAEWFFSHCIVHRPFYFSGGSLFPICGIAEEKVTFWWRKRIAINNYTSRNSFQFINFALPLSNIGPSCFSSCLFCQCDVIFFEISIPLLKYIAFSLLYHSEGLAN